MLYYNSSQGWRCDLPFLRDLSGDEWKLVKKWRGSTLINNRHNLICLNFCTTPGQLFPLYYFFSDVLSHFRPSSFCPLKPPSLSLMISPQDRDIPYSTSILVTMSEVVEISKAEAEIKTDPEMDTNSKDQSSAPDDPKNPKSSKENILAQLKTKHAEAAASQAAADAARGKSPFSCPLFLSFSSFSPFTYPRPLFKFFFILNHRCVVV